METEKKKTRKWGIGRILLLAAALLFLVWFLLSILTGVEPNIGNLTGIGIFGLLALYAIFLPNVNQFLKKLWKTTGGKVAEIAVGLILAAIFTFAAVTLGCIFQAAGKQPLPDSTLIVLGCKVNGHNPSLSLYYRLEAALEYLQNNPGSSCIVSGGQGRGEITTEASVMRQWLIDQGIPEEKVLPEYDASDTLENLTYSQALLEEHSELSQNPVIVTSDFHMYRAMKNAEKLGMHAASLSAKTPWWLFPTYVVREMYGIMEMWFLT